MNFLNNFLEKYNHSLQRLSLALGIRGLGLVFSIVVTFLLIDILDARNLGIFYFIISLARMTSIIASLGIFAAIIPEFSKAPIEKKEAILSQSIIPCLLISLVFFLLINSIFFFFPDSINETFWYVPFFSVLVVTYLIQFNLYNYFNCKQKLGLTSFMLEGNGRNFFFLPLVLIVYFTIEPSNYDIKILVNLLIISSVFTVIVGLINYDFRGLKKNFSLKTYFSFHKTGIKFLPSVLVSSGAPSIYEIYINLFFGPVTLAVFGVANRVLAPLMIHNDLLVLNYAKASSFYSNNQFQLANDLHKRSVAFSFSIALLLMTLFYFIGLNLISEFINFNKLPNIKEVIFIFFISSLVQSVCNFSLHFLRNIGDYFSITLIEAISVIGTVTLMYIFSDFGIIGAAIAILSGRLFMQLSGFTYAKYFYKIPMVLDKP
tara:strand:- start:31 stop:1323 length:1293 start_codon:yes stop_codon:yes gene_type:complete